MSFSTNLYERKEKRIKVVKKAIQLAFERMLESKLFYLKEELDKESEDVEAANEKRFIVDKLDKKPMSCIEVLIEKREFRDDLVFVLKIDAEIVEVHYQTNYFRNYGTENFFGLSFCAGITINEYIEVIKNVGFWNETEFKEYFYVGGLSDEWDDEDLLNLLNYHSFDLKVEEFITLELYENFVRGYNEYQFIIDNLKASEDMSEVVYDVSTGKIEMYFLKGYKIKL